MLEQASIDYNIDFQNSWLIGDEASDIQAGNLAGCKTIQILAGHDHDGLIREANFIARNLSEAANYILEYTNK
jgi:histidinol phosphatase-like enzyme